ncbi:hypothetical protein [Marinimicrobium sp. ABcell2]|uniref:hypothetical protein n=1 Tax=Marinimicrobium sp. ABcell2 TaxID=3069751 RepID=UPI0027B57260|nr:hypothetical protein [Marinimicrobium sp. ABcell2]MDQ2077211.1 hypothetical protein [Marinimicrobium sp. ABcell2]
MRTIKIVLFSLLCAISIATWAEEENRTAASQDYFDYTSVLRILVYTTDGTQSSGLTKPLSSDPMMMRASGRQFYELIMPYMAEAVEMVIPIPEDPVYVVDLLASDRFKRLYLGPGWINDGKEIAFISDEHWNSIVQILESRLERGISSVSTADIERKFENMDRSQPVTAEQEKRSIHEAIEEMGASSADSETAQDSARSTDPLPQLDTRDDGEQPVRQETVSSIATEHQNSSAPNRVARMTSLNGEMPASNVPEASPTPYHQEADRPTYALLFGAFLVLLLVAGAIRLSFKRR